MTTNGIIGGASTITGKTFEDKVDVLSFCIKYNDYIVKDGKYKTEKVIYNNSDIVARVMRGNDIYKLLKDDYEINGDDILSKKLLPDGFIINYNNHTIYIIEKKFQKIAGSVDEKLQTCAFKKRQYTRLFDKVRFNIEYVYVFNDWFKSDKYKDTLSYINEEGCHYFFYEISSDFLGF